MQLLSRTSGQAMTLFRGNKNVIQAQAVLTINNWSDCINSRRINHQNQLRCGLGRHLLDQIEALTKMEKPVQKLKISEVSHASPRQRGVPISIQSIRDHYDDLHNRDLEYFLTCRANQDILENLFSRIRAICEDNTHASPSEFTCHRRILLIGQN